METRTKPVKLNDSPYAPGRPPTRLSEDDVRDIYTRIWSKRESMPKLAEEFGLHHKTVRRIKHKKLWKAFTDELDREYGWLEKGEAT